ncbi:MAG: hypothetical protein Q8J64_03105 [Thermodesulfovibrionales bacterium]|nr:hypothetical protein [Thermodesulfovibrionales bacterium]
MMDINLMKTQGWSQELLDAINTLKDIVDKGAVKEPPLEGLSVYKIHQFSSASIDILNYSPVGLTSINPSASR